MKTVQKISLRPLFDIVLFKSDSGIILHDDTQTFEAIIGTFRFNEEVLGTLGSIEEVLGNAISGSSPASSTSSPVSIAKGMKSASLKTVLLYGNTPV